MPVALAAVLGIIIDRFTVPILPIPWTLLAITLATTAFLVRERPIASTVAILVAVPALSASWHHSCWTNLKSDDLARGATEMPTPTWVRGVIIDVLGFRAGESPENDGYTRAVLQIESVHDGTEGWRPVSGKATLGIVGDRSDLRAGDDVEAAGNLSLVAGPLNPGEFDYRAYLRTQGIRLKLAVDGPNGVWKDENITAKSHPFTGFIRRAIGKARAWSQEKLTQGLDPRTAPLAAALLLGRREGVDPDVNDAFARTGTTHLLAISGLHMQVLALAFGGVLRLVGVRRRTTFAAVGIATLVYTVLVGFMPSVVRSAAMTITYCLAGITDRPRRAANTLAFAALITLGLNPTHLFDVGCQLSFLAVAVIVWGSGPVWTILKMARSSDPLDALERKFEPTWKTFARHSAAVMLHGIAVSFLVWLAALPLTSLRFHIVSPISILLNVPLIPITSLALLASGTSLVMAAVWGPLGMPAAWLNAVLLGWTERIVVWGASLRWGHWFVAEPSWVWVLAYYLSLGLMTAAFLGRRRGRKGVGGAFVGVTAVGLFLSLFPGLSTRSRTGPPEALVLAVGHGQAVIIDTGGGHAVLYDCGKLRNPSVGRRIIAPALWSRGIRTIDAVILSHADADHYNGLPDLLDRFPVTEVLVPEGFAAGVANPGTAELLNLARSRGANVRSVVAGDRWDAGATRFAVRHPSAGWNPSASDNARSVVLEVSHAGRHMLLTGDLDGQGLTAFTESARSARVDVMLSPHHGGKSANPEWLYDRVAPARVVVSQRPPQAGSRDALSAVEARNIPVLRTWKRGALSFMWKETGVTASGFLDGIVPDALSQHGRLARSP